MGVVVVKQGASVNIMDRDRSEDLHSPEGDIAFEHILEICRFTAARIHENADCAQLHLENLKARGETAVRLRELPNWRDSFSFMSREKAALNLSEFISLNSSAKLAEDVLEEARQHLDTAEMVRLTLAITAINDWMNLQAESSTRVLVVEDNPHDQELLRRELQKAHLAEKVIFVPNAAQALDLLIGLGGELFRQKLVAIFLDIRLPGMGGIDLLQRIRIIPGMQNFPVIVMTSSNDPHDIEDCRRLRVACYVQKPVTFSSFSHAVANIFHRTTEMAA